MAQGKNGTAVIVSLPCERVGCGEVITLTTTHTEQARNTRRNRVLELNGETHTVPEWAHITGIKRSTISARYHAGWPVERCLTEGARP